MAVFRRVTFFLAFLAAFAAGAPMGSDPLEQPMEDARSALLGNAKETLSAMGVYDISFTPAYSPTTTSCTNSLMALAAQRFITDIQSPFNGAIGSMSQTSAPAEEIVSFLQRISPQFATQMDSFEIYGGNGGLGLGWGVNFYCGSDTTPVFSWGTGMGGGGQSITSSGYGGGAGGSSSKGEWGGGAGCDGSGSCNGGPDSGSTNDWLSLAQDALSCHDLLVCVSGGGGGGFSLSSESLLRGDGDSCELGAGFGFSGKSSSSTSTSNAAEASCSSGDDGGEYAGVAARLCAAQCQSKSNFNQCFCPCFKSAITGHGISWGNSIQCS